MLVRLFVILIITKTLGLALCLFLPQEGVDLGKNVTAQPVYQRYKTHNMITASNGTLRMSSGQGLNISELTLKGIYGSKRQGFAIVSLKSLPSKTEVISISETFKGYRLISIEKNAAQFKKNGTMYTLMMQDSKPLPAYKVASTSRNNVAETRKDEGDPSNVHVSRLNIEEYRQNVKRLWKDIGIMEAKKLGKIVGFKVTHLNASSPIGNVGLKNGDVIIKVNNKALTSYTVAMDVYKRVDKIKDLKITLMRDHKEKEITYEIF